MLWLLLLLSGLAATVAYIARVDALLARRGFDLARAQAAADAAIINTISRLSDERAIHRQPLGAAHTWEFDGISTTTSVTNEAGRIDVNVARDELLLAFLQAQGSNEQEAVALVKQLRAWQGSGMESSDRAPDPAASLPSRLHPLTSLEELKQIPGWREQPLNCWIPSLTVYSDRTTVAAIDATPGVMAALQWLQAHHPETRNPLSSLTAQASADRSFVGEVLRIRASASFAGVSATSEWIGRVTADVTKPTLTMQWEHVPQIAFGSCASATEH